MFFKWKKKYYALSERLERIQGYNYELYRANERSSRIESNLEIILNNDEFFSTELYKSNNIFYCIAEKRVIWTPTTYEIFYYTYKLSNIKLTLITTLEAKVNIGKNSVVITLDNIDTMCQKREGHASKQIEKLIKYGKDIRATKIIGELWEGTPIGIHNLRTFYMHNKFEVTENKISISL